MYKHSSRKMMLSATGSWCKQRTTHSLSYNSQVQRAKTGSFAWVGKGALSEALTCVAFRHCLFMFLPLQRAIVGTIWNPTRSRKTIDKMSKILFFSRILFAQIPQKLMFWPSSFYRAWKWNGMIFLYRCLQVMAFRESHWVYSDQPTGEMVWHFCLTDFCKCNDSDWLCFASW